MRRARPPLSVGARSRRRRALPPPRALPRRPPPPPPDAGSAQTPLVCFCRNPRRGRSRRDAGEAEGEDRGRSPFAGDGPRQRPDGCLRGGWCPVLPPQSTGRPALPGPLPAAAPRRDARRPQPGGHVPPPARFAASPGSGRRPATCQSEAWPRRPGSLARSLARTTSVAMRRLRALAAACPRSQLSGDSRGPTVRRHAALSPTLPESSVQVTRHSGALPALV